MIDIIKIIMGLSFPTLIGYFIIVKLGGKELFPNNIFIISVSYPLGMIIFTYTIFLSNIIFQIPITFVTSATTLIVLISIAFTVYNQNISNIIEKNRYNYYFIFVILFLILYYGYISLQVPVTDLPEKSIWGGKAKMFFIDNGINIERLFSTDTLYIQGSYPLGFPLLLTWISLCINRFDPVLIKIIPTFHCFICSVSLYCILKQDSKHKYFAELSTFLFITSEIFLFLSWKVYADIYLFSLVIPVIYCFVKALENPNNSKILIIGSLLLGSSVFIKNEGLLYFILVSILFIIVKIKLIDKKELLKIIKIFAIITTVFIIPQKIFVFINGNELRDFSIYEFSNHFNWTDIKIISNRFFQNIILKPRQYNCIWFIGIGYVFINIKKIISSKENLFLSLIISFSIFCFFMTFFFSTRNLSWHLLSVSRILLIPTILTLLLIKNSETSPKQL